MKKIALVTAQGTAAYETVLLDSEDTPEARQRIEDQFCNGSWDAPVRGSWTDVTDNEAFDDATA